MIDHFEKVTDRDAAIMTSRIAREEGIFAGNSAGSAMAGLLQLADRFKEGETVVVIFHDHGTRYLGKMYNPEWMREKGFLDRTGLTAKDLVADRKKARLTTIDRNETVSQAANLMTEHAYSQLPVTAGGRLVGIGEREPPVRADREEPGAAEGTGRGHHGARASRSPTSPRAWMRWPACSPMPAPRCWCATSRATRPTSSRGGT